VSLRTLDNAIQLLEEKAYIASRERELIVRLLKLVPASEATERDAMTTIFQKSTYRLKHIPADAKRRASRLLKLLKQAFEESVDLTSLFNSLQIGSIEQKIKREEVAFRQIFDGTSLISPCVQLLQELNIYSYSANEPSQKLVVFGPKRADEFWKLLEEKHSSYKTELPSIDALRSMLIYYGDLPKPFAALEAHMAGNRFPFEIIEDADINRIPQLTRDSVGTVGAFVRVQGNFYAVTACHVVSRIDQIADHTSIYRGDYNGYYMDVAFLRVRQGEPVQQFLNSHASLSWRADDYTDYWANYMEQFPAYTDPFPDADSFPPGTDVQKLGYGSGHTNGQLVNARAAAHFGEDDIKNQVVAIRWSPDRPFSKGNDSGSVYYAVMGCMRYPIAIHFGAASYHSRHLKGSPTLLNEVVSFGTRLREAVDWWVERNGFGDEMPEWFFLE